MQGIGDGGDGSGGGVPQASPTPTPPGDSGLKEIGRTHARWNPDDYEMSNAYGDGSTLKLPFSREQFVGAMTKCGIHMAAAVSAAAGFVGAMEMTFGARIAAAAGGVALTELTIWEAVGVALSTIPAWEIIAAGIATIGTMADLYLLYICLGGTSVI
ncbi:MAG: hypothetical protein M3N13_01410 [Candidatus Eremiobacteraeota bacterium]|nr:hypothetical protein [Candidatus Eremiobacteraeota bacterium]